MRVGTATWRGPQCVSFWFILQHIPASSCALVELVLGVSFPDTLPPVQKLLGIDSGLHQYSHYLFWHLELSPYMASVQAPTTMCSLAAMKILASTLNT